MHLSNSLEDLFATKKAMTKCRAFIESTNCEQKIFRRLSLRMPTNFMVISMADSGQVLHLRRQ
jgi:hypothetical protein